MKIDVNYNKVHGIIRDLKEHPNGFMLGATEVDILLQILSAAEGDIFPSKQEMQTQEINCRILERHDPDSDTWKRALAETTEFENKYC